ncbi:Sphingosine N-acyltransferase lag1 [Diplonema papillatum]|nr:Sphingosine N-acyltransferase lag1 [Diplonema papillatum]
MQPPIARAARNTKTPGSTLAMGRVGESTTSQLLSAAIMLLTVWTFLYETPLHLEAEDVQYLACSTAALCLFRICWPSIFSRRVFDLVNPAYDDPSLRAKSRDKCASHANKLFMHSFFLVWGFVVLGGQEWFEGWSSTEGVWEGYEVRVEQPVPYRRYYLSQLSFFLSSLVMQCSEPRSHDHVAMLAHHYGSAALVVISYHTRCHRLGLLALLSREVTDVFIHLARAFGLLKFTKVAEATLASMLVLWFFTRNLFHPAVICRAAFFSPSRLNYTAWAVGNVLLAMLIPLDLYYLFLGLEAVVRRIRNPTLAQIDPDAPSNAENHHTSIPPGGSGSGLSPRLKTRTQRRETVLG